MEELVNDNNTTMFVVLLLILTTYIIMMELSQNYMLQDHLTASNHAII